MVLEPLEDIKQLELLRLDGLLSAIWPSAIGGDIAAVDMIGDAAFGRQVRPTGLLIGDARHPLVRVAEPPPCGLGTGFEVHTHGL